MPYSLKDLIDITRHRTSYPERGEAGDERFRVILNEALRELWGEIPEAYKLTTWRFKTGEVYDFVAESDATDPHVFLAPTGTLPTDGTCSGRWLEVKRGNLWVQRRVLEVYEEDVLLKKIIIVLEEPWDTLGETDLTCRLWTAEYPYPADAEAVTRLVWRPELGGGTPIKQAVFPDQLDQVRHGAGWRSTTEEPEYYSSGHFLQLRTPRYTPTAGYLGSGEQIPATSRWGYDIAGIERTAATNPFFGAAGTFSYIEVPVWGRWPWLHPTHLRNGSLPPFYVGAPSLPTSQVTTTWGGWAIRVESPDLHYLMGFGQDQTLLSYQHAGYEKWVFRARHATQSPTGAGNNAAKKLLEADGVYYLWRIFPGYTTSYEDRGDFDPPDRDFPLRPFHGHQAIRFSEIPDGGQDVLMTYRQRPPVLEHSADVPRIHPECLDAALLLAYSILLGERDGDPERKADYYRAYREKLAKLKASVALPAFVVPEFGNGISPSRSGMARIHGSKISV